MLSIALALAFALVAAAFALSLWRLLRGPQRAGPHPGPGHPVHQRHRPAGAARHPPGQRPLLRGGAADRPDGLRRHRRPVQVPVARRHHRVTAMLDLLLSLLILAGAAFTFVGSLGLVAAAGLLHPPARPHQGDHPGGRQPADRLRPLLQHPGRGHQPARGPGDAVSVHHGPGERPPAGQGGAAPATAVPGVAAAGSRAGGARRGSG